MARFEVDVKMIVEADDDTEAYAMAEAAAQNLVCGAILEVEMGGVLCLEMAGWDGQPDETQEWADFDPEC